MKKIQTKLAPQAIGPYSQAIQVGDFLFCSGQIPLVPETMVLEEADIRVQSRRVFKNIKGLVEGAGAKVSQVVKTTAFLTDLKNFDVFNQEYSAFFESEGVKETYPARSTIQVAGLPKGSMVEVEVVVFLGRSG